jgi:2-iminoacetate synthase ThiH
MGAMLTRAIDEAGFSEAKGRLLAGESLSASELERLRRADLLVVAGLADLVRKQFRGDEVRLIASSHPQATAVCVFAAEADNGEASGATGAEVLRNIALTRLQIPNEKGLAVSLDELGVELAQTALVFGADVLFGDLGGKRTLPLIDGPEARRTELTGLIERSGRKVVFEAVARGTDLEQRS